jgi:NH3-dependent NAD+ synthetase
LQIDCAAEADRISRWIVATLANRLRRRGLVVAISGGIDSSVCAGARRARARPATGLRPAPAGAGFESVQHRAWTPAGGHLGIAHETFDIGPALEALGCYERRDAAIRRVFSAYGEGWRSKLAIAGGKSGGINYFKLVVESPTGTPRRRGCRCASTWRSSRRRTSSSGCERRWTISTPIASTTPSSARRTGSNTTRASSSRSATAPPI